MKISVVLGTRPEIIKMSPIIKELEKNEIDFFIIHTGQHYSYNLDQIFFKQLDLTKAKYNLKVGSGSHVEHLSSMLVGIEKILFREKPDITLVQGDTNTTLSGALCANKLGIEVGHIEAGLRSYDRQMPEEINRKLIDHCSDFLFTPTEHSAKILFSEGVPEENIYVTGNTIVDVVYQYFEKVHLYKKFREKHGLGDDYILATVHRQENVDSRSRFSSILRGLEMVSEYFDVPILYPVHPRAKKMLKKFNLDQNLMLIEPVDFLTFLQLEKNAKLILTDSGGVQEEACILGVPCVTLRNNTERPETVDIGANIIAGVKSQEILNNAILIMKGPRNWDNPFGNGKTAKKILEILRQYYG